MAKKYSRNCAYCGRSTTDWTDDHVIPDCMWGDRDLPNRLITVRTCATCNGYWSIYEGHFRSVVAIMSNGDNPIVEEIVKGDVCGHVAKDFQFAKSILGTTKQVPSFNELGLFTGHNWTFRMDWNRWDTVVGKIVRGMVFFDLNQPLPRDYVVQSWRGSDYTKDETARAIIDQMSPKWANMGEGDTVFVGKRSYSSSDPFQRVFLLTFYESVTIFAWTCPASDALNVDPSHPDQVAMAVAERARKKLAWKAKHKQK